MGTRSDIIVHRTDGKWSRVYCHWDGYLDHNGRILFDHYTSQAMAEELVSHGDMSSLRPKCSKPKGHSFDHPVEGYCVYYGRDRGEADCGAKIGDSLFEVWPEADSWTEFTYVWDNGKWYCGDPDQGTQTLYDLGDLLLGKKKLRPMVKAPWGVVGQHSGELK